VWNVAGVKVFNGDGTADLLWQNQVTGTVGAWIVQNGKFNRWASLGQTNPLAWGVGGVGDFNGNGTADVLWQNQSTGSVGAWIVRNAAYDRWTGLGQADRSKWALAGTATWQGRTAAYLQADTVIVSPATDVSTLARTDLQPVVNAAIARWAAAGLDAAILERLAHVEFVLADLSGSSLGKAEGNRIYLDSNAAGHGWFVDSTPVRDEEFTSSESDGRLLAVDPRAVDRIDLLTVVEHELGHIAGFDDLDALVDDVMSGVLSAGIRRNASHTDAVLAAE
jgi:hypothetical protein